MAGFTGDVRFLRLSGLYMCFASLYTEDLPNLTCKYTGPIYPTQHTPNPTSLVQRYCIPYATHAHTHARTWLVGHALEGAVVHELDRGDRGLLQREHRLARFFGRRKHKQGRCLRDTGSGVDM